MSTSFRRDVTLRFLAVTNDFIAANPTLLLRVFARRPMGFTGDLPAAYVGAKNETLAPTRGRWPRSMEPQIVLVGQPTGSEDEIADEMDVLVDAFLDYFNERPHAISSNTVCWPHQVRDVELELDAVTYPATVITFTALSAEGRL